MTSARDAILARIAHALADTPTDPTPYHQAIDRAYLSTHAHRTPHQRLQLLTTHLTDYRANVHHTTHHELPSLITHLLTTHGTQTAVVPNDLPDHWLTPTRTTTAIRIHTDHPTLTHHDLDHIDTAITGCTLAIAETGTIVLNHGPAQGHRRITLIPDHHICVIHTHQIHDSLPQALPHLDPTHPHTWISGPSATSDIELTRVEGVHGPRTLDAVVTTD